MHCSFVLEVLHYLPPGIHALLDLQLATDMCDCFATIAAMQPYSDTWLTGLSGQSGWCATNGRSQMSFKNRFHTCAWHPKHIRRGMSSVRCFQAAFMTLQVSVTKAAVLVSSLCFRNTSRTASATFRATGKHTVFSKTQGVGAGTTECLHSRHDGNQTFNFHELDDSPVSCSVLAVVISMK